MQILALDVGTSSVKAAVVDVVSRRPVGPVARVAYALDYPSADAAEVPAERVWGAVTAAGREAAQTAHVEAIGLSCLMPALLLLDSADRPIGPIWTHLDRRARPAARQVLAEVGAEFLASVGNRPLPGGISVLCYKQQRLDDPRRTKQPRWYLHANSWLGLRLTGERAFDRGNACFTGLYGTVTDQAWSQRWCSYFDVDPDWLPRVVCGSTTLGSLRKGAADELGLPVGLPVKLGTADTSSAMLAAGMRAGDLLHVVGTTQVLAALTQHPRPSEQRLTRQLGVGDRFIQVTHNPVGGVALDWMHALCFREQSADTFYNQSIQEALLRETSVRLEPPFLGGDRLEIEPHRAAFRELTLSADRLDLLSALLRAMVEKHRLALTALGMGSAFQRIFLTGGGAEIIRRLIPEYARLPVQMLDEGSLRGVACLFDSFSWSKDSCDNGAATLP